MSDLLTIKTINETETGKELDLQIRRYLLDIFPEWGEVFKKRRAWHDAIPFFTVLAMEQGEIVGHIAVVERTITTSWNFRYDAASFQGVSIRPDRRGQRLSLRLLDRALDESRKRGYPFAILYCREPLVPFYQKTGWKLPEDSMIMWRERALPIAMRSNCPMYRELKDIPFPEGPTDVHNPLPMEKFPR